MAVIQLLHMMICAPSNYTFLILGEKERERVGRKKQKPVVILKPPLDDGLIIVCLVFAMAVIETLAVRVYIQHVGGSRAPCGRVLIISLDHKSKLLLCTSLPFFVFTVFLHLFFLIFQIGCMHVAFISGEFVWLQNHYIKSE